MEKKNIDLDIVESLIVCHKLGALHSLHTLNKECVKEKTLSQNKENVAYN